MHAILANWCSVLRPVKLTSDPRCGLREWPVLPLRGGTNYFVHATFLALRAHAASLGGIRNGLRVTDAANSTDDWKGREAVFRSPHVSVRPISWHC